MDPFEQNRLDRLFETQAGHPTRMKRRESTTLEVKENFNLSPDAKALYSRTMAGFANNEGGYLLFGVKDKPHDLVGMTNTNFDIFDPTQLQSFLSEYFAPTISWKHQMHSIGERRFGIIYVHSARSKPVVCIKQGPKELKDGDVFFRYQGETKKIKSPELHQIILDRVDMERRSWQAFLRESATINAPSSVLLDTVTGAGSSDGRRFIVSEELLSRINFIREGRFSEEGDRTLRIVGDVEVVRPEAIIVETGVPQDISPDYPFPTKKLVAHVNEVLGTNSISTHDVAAVLKNIHDVENRPEWYYRNQVMSSAPQYSQAYADWIIEQINRDADFVRKQRQIAGERRLQDGIA